MTTTALPVNTVSVNTEPVNTAPANSIRTIAMPANSENILQDNMALKPALKHAPGQRILISGNSNSGKSTLAAELAELFDYDFVELDALNFEGSWTGLNESNPTRFKEKVAKATAGEHWVVAGSYENFSKGIFWQKLDTIIWLDLPMPLLVWRMLRRSWKRWRTQELLWGSNREYFWPQLMVWRKEESLLWWIITKHKGKRQNILRDQVDPKWKHINFIRLDSVKTVDDFVRSLK